MYDRKSEANEFVGESIEDATASAARFYGVEAEDLDVVAPEAGFVAGTGGRTVVVAVPKNVKRAPERRERPERKGRNERKGRSERRPEPERGSERMESRERPAPATPPQPVGESRGTVRGEVGPTGEFLLGVVERLGLGSFEISESAEGEFVVYEIRGEASAALGAGDGRAVDALQLLGNQAAKNGVEDAPRIVVDVEGGAEERGDSLERLANRAASRAVESGHSVALDPMNPRDRRIIHVTLRDHENVATMSVGEARYRQVVVVPEGAPEYEKARQSGSQTS